MSRRLTPPPANSFAGPFMDFYVKHIEPNLPTPEAVKHLHGLLVQYVRDEATSLFVVRKFDGRIRGQRFPGSTRGLSLVCGDNEPALWFYARAFLEDFRQQIPSVAEAVESRRFPIGFARKGAAGESSAFWSNWGRKPWEAGDFGGIGLYHAHLFDAANRIPAQTLDRRNLTARMIRFLHPANHFPMPTHHGHHPFMVRGYAKDLSELPGIKRMICDQYARRYQDVWAEFLALADAKPSDFERVDNLWFECSRAIERDIASPSATKAAVANESDTRELRRSSTRFRVDEQMYLELRDGAGPLVIEVSGGSGNTVHPTGRYRIPRLVALRFIESKRDQPHWHNHRSHHSVSVPVPLRAYFERA